LNEKSAGVTSGSLDLVWINGENFRTAKQGRLLRGPFAEQLTNIKYFDETAWRREWMLAACGNKDPDRDGLELHQ